MKKLMTLILISALALVLTQCSASVKSERRTQNNLVGVWIGVTGGEKYVFGVNIKHFNPRFLILHTFFNASSGYYFGGKGGVNGMSFNTSFNLSTDEIYFHTKPFWLDGTAGGGTSPPFQFYVGPNLGANLIMSKNGKAFFKLNPTFGATGGMSIAEIFVIDGIAQGNIFKTSQYSGEGLVIGRFLFNLYPF